MKHPKNRATRRHHRERVIKNRARKISWVRPKIEWAENESTMSPEKRQKFISKTLGAIDKTKVNCSCWMCGNPRNKIKGQNNDTIKEKIFDDILKEDLELFFEDKQ